MKVLGVNAVFHDPAAALVVDGQIVAAAEEERFSRRKHGKPPVAFSTWELPEQSARWCLEHAGLEPQDLDAVAYSYDPALAPPTDDVTDDAWEGLRTLYVRRAPRFLHDRAARARPGDVRFVPHHVAHAASAYAGRRLARLRDARARRPRRARPPTSPATSRDGSWRCWRRSGCRTRSGSSTRS